MPALAAEEVEEKELSAWQAVRWALEFDLEIDVQVRARILGVTPGDHIIDMGTVRLRRKGSDGYHCTRAISEPVGYDMVTNAYRVGVAGKWAPWQAFQHNTPLVPDNTFQLYDMVINPGDD